MQPWPPRRSECTESPLCMESWRAVGVETPLNLEFLRRDDSTSARTARASAYQGSAILHRCHLLKHRAPRAAREVNSYWSFAEERDGHSDKFEPKMCAQKHCATESSLVRSGVLCGASYQRATTPPAPSPWRSRSGNQLLLPRQRLPHQQATSPSISPATHRPLPQGTEPPRRSR